MGSTFRRRFSRKRVLDWLDATYRSNVCNEQDCNGNRMPGIARNMGFASIGYVPEDGWYAGTEARYMGDIMADDENTAKSAVLYSRRLIHRV